MPGGRKIDDTQPLESESNSVFRIAPGSGVVRPTMMQRVSHPANGRQHVIRGLISQTIQKSGQTTHESAKVRRS
jgi:hypothetical protein